VRFKSLCRLFAALSIGAGLSLVPALGAPPAAPVAFELMVSPSRFLLAAKAGESVSQSIDLENLGVADLPLAIRTLDWSFSNNANPVFSDALTAGSCRPWVALERRQLSVAAKQKRVYRFQVDVPADAGPRECRFMIAFEGGNPAAVPSIDGAGGARMRAPVSARIAVPVYIAVAGARPKLAGGELLVVTRGAQRFPAIRVTNAGDAHGRLSGLVDAVDGDGNDIMLEPVALPILPGQTAVIELSPFAGRGERPRNIVWPLRITGRLEWDDGSLSIEGTLP